MSRLATLLILVILAACASPAPSATARSVRDGDPAVVNRDCKLLGTVSGRSMWGGSDETRREIAINDAREKAAAMGATHVVFIASDNSAMLGVGHATARAYRCDKGA
jgi:hypothetical protein